MICLTQTEIFALDFCSLRDFSTAVSEHFVYTLLPALNMQLILFALKYSSISFFMSSISVCGKLKSSNQIIMSLFFLSGYGFNDGFVDMRFIFYCKKIIVHMNVFHSYRIFFVIVFIYLI